MKTFTTETLSKTVHFNHKDLQEILRKHLNSPTAILSLWRIDDYDEDYDPVILSMTTTEKKEYEND